MLSFICGPDFVGLSDVIKNGHTRAKNDGQDIENWQLLEKLDSQNIYFLHIRTGVNKVSDHMKNLCSTVEELRTDGANGNTGEVTAKAGSLSATLNRNLADLLENQEHTDGEGTWPKMAQWWAEIAASLAASDSNEAGNPPLCVMGWHYQSVGPYSLWLNTLFFLNYAARVITTVAVIGLC